MLDLRRGKGVLGFADVECQDGRGWSLPGPVDEVIEHETAAIELANIAINAVGQVEENIAKAGVMRMLLIEKMTVGVGAFQYQGDSVVGFLARIGADSDSHRVGERVQYSATGREDLRCDKAGVCGCAGHLDKGIFRWQVDLPATDSLIA